MHRFLTPLARSFTILLEIQTYIPNLSICSFRTSFPQIYICALKIISLSLSKWQNMSRLEKVTSYRNGCYLMLWGIFLLVIIGTLMPFFIIVIILTEMPYIMKALWMQMFQCFYELAKKCPKKYLLPKTIYTPISFTN